VVEQPDRQVNTTDQLELGQFLVHAREAGFARIAAQPQERRRRTGRHIDHLNIAEQPIEALARGRRQTRVDIGVKPLLMSPDCGAHNALHPVDRRRFNRELTTSGFQALDERLNLASGFRGSVIAQPSGERVGIGYRELPKSESRSNLGPKAFGGSLGKSQPNVGRDGHPDLCCQSRGIHNRQIGWLTGEPPVIAEENQPGCKGEPIFPALRHHHGEITGRQGWYGRFDAHPIFHDAITSVYATLGKRR
jgi:hypothetical protein